MEPQEITRELEAVFRFSRYATARQWAATLPSPPGEGEMTGLYKQEERRMARMVELAVPHLVEQQDLPTVLRLAKATKGQVFQALCQALAEQAYAPAVPVLAPHLRVAGSGARLAILTLIRVTGGLEGYAEALEQAHRTGEPEVIRAAEAALAAIRERHPALGIVDQLAAGGSPPVVSVPAGDLARMLAGSVPLRTALQALPRLAELDDGAANAVRAELLLIAVRENTPTDDDADSEEKRARLLLASQPWPLPVHLSDRILESFTKGKDEERQALLKAATPVAAARLLAHGLLAAPKWVRQSIRHLKRGARPELLPLLEEPLRKALQSHDPDIRRDAQDLLGRAAVRSGGSTHDLQALLFEGTAKLGLLYKSDAGRRVMAGALLSPDQWKSLAGTVSGDPDRSRATEFFALAAAPLETWAAADGARVRWLLERAPDYQPEALQSALPALDRGVGVQALAASDAEWTETVRAIRRLPAALAQRLLRSALRTAPAARLAGVLTALESGDPGLLEALTDEIAAARVRLGQILDLTAALPDAGAWLQQSPAGKFAGGIISGELEALRLELDTLRTQYLTGHQEDQRTQTRAASRLFQAVEGVLVSHAASFTRTDLQELSQTLADLSAEIYRSIDRAPAALPELPALEGERLAIYRNARVVERTIRLLTAERQANLRVQLALDAGRALRKLLLALQNHSARAAVSDLLAQWITGLGLQIVEPELGRRVAYQEGRHELLPGAAPAGQSLVAAWGYQLPDGRVLRPALLAPATTL